MSHVSYTFSVKIPLILPPMRVSLWLIDSDIPLSKRIASVRKHIARDIAREIIGVQPMTGPASLIYSMSTRYAEPITIALWLR